MLSENGELTGFAVHSGVIHMRRIHGNKQVHAVEALKYSKHFGMGWVRIGRFRLVGWVERKIIACRWEQGWELLQFCY